MAFWSSLFRRTERKYDTLELFREIYGGKPARTGISVTWASALEVATVLACMRVIAEGIAQVPWKLYDGQNSKPAVDHPLYRVIYRKPNRWQTSFEFRETIAFHAALTGNAYVFVGRVGSKREVKELVPLEPQFVSIEKNGDTLTYKYSPTSGQSVLFDSSMIWHIKGASWNAWAGMDAVKLVREAVGLAVAAESAHAEMHKGGSRIGGLYTVEGNLSKEQYEFLAKWLDAYAMGGERAGKPMILDRGAKFAAQQMTGVDAQHLETRKHQIEEICRSFRVMPIMIGYSDKAATYASAEQMFIAHVVHCLQPWYERLEQSADTVLLTEEEQRQGLYTKFTPNALMRGAAKDRAEFYQRAIGSVNASPGWMSVNQIRALEEMPPDDDPESDKIFRPDPAASKADATAMKELNDKIEFIKAAKPQSITVTAPPVDFGMPEQMKAAFGEVVNTIEALGERTAEIADRMSSPPVVNVAPPKVVIEHPERKLLKKHTEVLSHDEKGRIKTFETTEVYE